MSAIPLAMKSTVDKHNALIHESVGDDLLTSFERSVKKRPLVPGRDRVEINLAVVANELKCPICLDILNQTVAVNPCLHRFCNECIEMHLRQLVNAKKQHECPSCRAPITSRRVLRRDTNFDEIILKLLPRETFNALAQQDEKIDLASFKVEHKKKIEEWRAQGKEMRKNLHAYEVQPTQQKAKGTGKGGKGSKPKRQSSAIEKEEEAALARLRRNEEYPHVCFTFCPCPLEIQLTPSIFKDLIKPYIRAPAYARIMDMKAFVQNRFASTEELQPQQSAPEPMRDVFVIYVIYSDRVIIMNDGNTLETIAKELWDRVSELKIYYGRRRIVDRWLQGEKG
jgi:hypothetical protein